MTTTSGPITPASESGITHAYILRRCLLRPPCIYREVRIHTPTFWRRGSDEKGTLTCLAQRGGRRRIWPSISARADRYACTCPPSLTCDRAKRAPAHGDKRPPRDRLSARIYQRARRDCARPSNLDSRLVDPRCLSPSSSEKRGPLRPRQQDAHTTRRPRLGDCRPRVAHFSHKHIRIPHGPTGED